MVHCLVLAYPAQGHINPMLHFSNILHQQGVKVTFVTTISFCNNNFHNLPSSLSLQTISDGFDNGGIHEAGSYRTYLQRFWQVGPNTLADLLHKLHREGDPVHCVIYDSLFPWPLEVAKRFQIAGASFLTQNMFVNTIYYHVQHGNLQLPITQNQISLPPLPELQRHDMPSFFFPTDADNPALLDLLVGQFSTVDEADWILCNSFYDAEKEVSKFSRSQICLRHDMKVFFFFLT